MKLTSWDVLPIVRKFRDEVDKSKFFIRGDTPNNELNALGKRLLSHLGWEESDRLYALIDVTIDPDSVKEKKINRAIALSAGGVYVATLPEAREKWTCDFADEADDVFISWDDIGSGFSLGDEDDAYRDYHGWPTSAWLGEGDIKVKKIPDFLASFHIGTNQEWLGKFYPTFSLIADCPDSWEWPSEPFSANNIYLNHFICDLHCLCERRKKSTCHESVIETEPSVISDCENVLRTYLQSHKDLPPMDATSISDVCAHNVYHAKVSAKYLTRKWMSIKGASETEIDNVEGSDIWNVPGLGEEGDGVAILPNSEHMESCTTCFGHGEHLCASCRGTGRHECHHCHGEKKEECPSCHGEKHTICHECDGHGLVVCKRCEGTGYDRDECSVCNSAGEIEKTRLVNCSRCHGAGTLRSSGNQVSDEIEDALTRVMRGGAVPSRVEGNRRTCLYCDGRGQVEETYYEKCPQCHGVHYIKTNRQCPSCEGRGKLACEHCNGTGRADCDECNGAGRVPCVKCGGKGSVKCECCDGDTNKRYICIDCFATGKMRHAIRVNQEQHDVGVNWCFSDSVHNALLPSVLPDWHREVIVNCSSSKTTVEDPHLSQGISPCLREAWEYIIAAPAQAKKVRFQDQQVLLERSAYLVSCDYFSYGIAHKAWIDLHQMQVVMIDKQVTAEVNKRDALSVGDSVKQEYACCSIETLMDFDRGIKLCKEDKYKEAFPLLKPAAECGVVEAVSETGEAYYRGAADISDAEKSKKISFELLKKAALAGSRSGAAFLGWAFYYGSGVARDDRKAYELILNSVSRGFCRGAGWPERLLASCYDDGRGVDEDKPLANKLYRRLANRGNSKALYCLGLNYLNGSGVAKNEQEAFRLISLSAARGNSDAKKKLKEMGPVNLQGQNLESGAVGVDFTGVDVPLELGKPMSVEDILALPSGRSASDKKRMKGAQGSDKGNKQKRKSSSVLYSYTKKRFLFFIIGLSLGWLGWHFRYAGRKNYFWVYWAAVITLLFAPRHSILWNCCCLAIAWLWIGCTLFMRNDGDKRRMPWFK